jgi:hypothetical protein
MVKKTLKEIHQARMARINKQINAQNAKRKLRSPKAKKTAQNKALALGKVPNVSVAKNYINPVTLNAPPRGVVVFKVTDKHTGRTNYYDRTTLFRFLANFIKNNYNLLMADPKKTLFRNPVTRGNVKARNIQRVRIIKSAKTPTKSAAARKIQTAVRKHLNKKKPKRVTK